MLDFKPFGFAINKRLSSLSQKELYFTDVNTEELWNFYLNSIPKEFNPVFKERTEHDCNCCKQFIRNLGGLVAIVDGKIESIWNVTGLEEPYQIVADAVNEFVLKHSIKSIYRTVEKSYGNQVTKALLNTKVVSFDHFHFTLPSKYTNKQASKIIGDFNQALDLFSRSLETLTKDALETVSDLIVSNSIYRGQEFAAGVTAFLNVKTTYNALKTKEEREIFLIEEASKTDSGLCKFKNTVIGTFVEDLSKGVDLEAATAKYEAKVAPQNYKRTSALVTPKMVEEALEKVKSLDLEDALLRRFATPADLTINNVIWANSAIQKKFKSEVESMFEGLATKKAKPKNNKPVNTSNAITFEELFRDILPEATGVEIKLENKDLASLVTLTTGKIDTDKRLFPWDNSFGWSYTGNITDSDIRQKVQAKGGRVDGVLRFSHSWNHRLRNASLMDLHVFMPGSTKIAKSGNNDDYGNTERVGWNHRQHSRSKGSQDVDYTAAAPEGYVPVENITFPELNLLKDGKYECMIHNWSLRAPTIGGFQAEIECGGRIYEYVWDTPLKNKEWIHVATVQLEKGVFTVTSHIPESSAPTTSWNLKTQEFIPVNTICLSPNHWDGNSSGNKHYMFLIDQCKCDEKVRGIYNEFLKPELAPHRKVFELLGTKSMCEPTDDQLSGVGFSSTKQSEVTIRVTNKNGKKEYVVRT